MKPSVHCRLLSSIAMYNADSPALSCFPRGVWGRLISHLAFIESFNGKFRTECLNASWFLSLEEARSKCETWRQDYNEFRPHSSIGQKTPMELARASGQVHML